jgi:hypothetical protein
MKQRDFAVPIRVIDGSRLAPLADEPVPAVGVDRRFR